jgi:hypothetical protein
MSIDPPVTHCNKMNYFTIGCERAVASPAARNRPTFHECHLPKLDVVGSNPVSRSKIP